MDYKAEDIAVDSSINPFYFKPRDEESRKRLFENQLPDYAELKLTDHQKKAIIGFSDDFGLNEMECLRAWIHVSVESNRRTLEAHIGLTDRALDGKLALAAEEYIYYQRECKLRRILALLKSRSDVCLADWQMNDLMDSTNALLKGELLSVIIKYMKEGVTLLTKPDSSSDATTKSPLSPRRIKFYVLALRLFADSLFFTSYSTQLIEKEVWELESLLQFVCSVISTPRIDLRDASESQISSPDSVATAAGVSNSMLADTKSQLIPVFVVLQLVLMNAFNTAPTLLSREANNTPSKNVLNVLYDSLSQVSEWEAPGVYGLLCLCYASIGHTILEDTKDSIHSPTAIRKFVLPPSMAKSFENPDVALNDNETIFEYNKFVVQHLLAEMVKSRVFSYVRLCLLPVLQSSFLEELDLAAHYSASGTALSFYLSVLDECVMQRISHIFMHPFHLGEYGNEAWGLPFIPLSQQRFYNDEFEYYQEQKEKFEYEQRQLFEERAWEDQHKTLAEEAERNKFRNTGLFTPYDSMEGMRFLVRQSPKKSLNGDSQVQAFPNFEIVSIDCQDDLIRLYVEYLRCRPTAAVYFMVSEDADMVYSEESSAKIHPFLMRLIAGVEEDSSLTAQVLNLLAALCGAPNTMKSDINSAGINCAQVVFHTLRNKANIGNRIDWGFIFQAIDGYISELSLSSEPVEAVQSSALRTPQRGFSSLLGSSHSPIPTAFENPQPKQRKRRKFLAARDTDALLAILELITRVISASTDISLKDTCSHASRSTMIDELILMYKPVAKLFSLLCNCSTSLSLQLKGKIFATLSSFVYYSGVVHHDSAATCSDSLISEVWQLMEFYALVVPSQSSDQNSSHQGLKYELDSVESVEGNYPVTDGFLTLLDMLISYSGSTFGGVFEVATARTKSAMYACGDGLSSVGLGSRVPGIIPYLEYVVDILCNSHLRYYSTSSYSSSRSGVATTVCANNFEGNAQRYKIVSKCLHILQSVIQKYEIHTLSALNSDDLIRYFGSQKDYYCVANSVDGTLQHLQEITQSEPVNIEAMRAQDLLFDFNDNIILDYPFYAPQRAQAEPQRNQASFTPVKDNTQRERNVLRAVKTKSAGFHVMAMLLNLDDKVLQYIFQLLSELNVATMLYNSSSISGYIANKRVADLIYAQSASHHILEIQHQQLMRHRVGIFAPAPTATATGSSSWFTEASNTGAARSSFLLPIFSDILMTQTSMNLDYSSMESCYNNRYYTDFNYWQQRVVMHSFGVLYECSLREEMFVRLFQQQPVSVRRGGSLSPLNIQPLPTLLTSMNIALPTGFSSSAGSYSAVFESNAAAGNTSVSPLTLVTSYLPLYSSDTVSLTAASWCMSPVMPIVVIKLLQHVVLYLINSGQNFAVLEKMFGLSGKSFRDSGMSHAMQLIRNCESTLIHFGDTSSTLSTHTSIALHQITPLISRYNSDECFYFHSGICVLTPSPDYTSIIATSSGKLQLFKSIESIAYINEAVETAAEENLDEHGLDGMVASYDNIVGSEGEAMLLLKSDAYQLSNVRYVLLKMLLTCLAASNGSVIPNVSLAHYVLFGAGTVSQQGRKHFNGFNAMESMAKLDCYSSMFNEGCLHIIVNTFLNPMNSMNQKGINIDSLSISRPEEALLCYEIIHLLCKDIVFSEVMFSYLRDPKVNFTVQQLYLFADYFDISKSISDNNSVTDGVELTANNISEDIRYISHINNCCAWLLKILAMEIHVLEVSSSDANNTQFGNSSTRHLTKLLTSILHYDKQVGSVASSENADNLSPIMEILSHISQWGKRRSDLVYSLPAVFMSNPLFNYCVNESNEIYSVCSLPISSKAANLANAKEFSLICNSSCAFSLLPMGFRVINIEKFMQLLLESNETLGRNAKGAISVDERKYCMHEAIRWNLYNMTVASQSHLSIAWRMLIDVMIGECGTLLLSNGVCGAPNATIPSKPFSLKSTSLDINQLLSKEGLKVDEKGALALFTTKLSEFVDMIIIPTTNSLLVAQHGKHHASRANPKIGSDALVVARANTQDLVEMSVCENIAKSLYSMLFLVNYASTVAFVDDNGDSCGGWISTDQFTSIARYVTSAVLRSNASTVTPSTMEYRVSLYCSLLMLLQYCLPSEEGEVVNVDSYREVLHSFIAPNFGIILDNLCNDIVVLHRETEGVSISHRSPASSRIVSMNLLSELLSLLVASGDSADTDSRLKSKSDEYNEILKNIAVGKATSSSTSNSLLLVHSVQRVLAKGFLGHMLAVTTNNDVYDAQYERQTVATRREIFIATLSLCSRFAIVPGGLQYLLRPNLKDDAEGVSIFMYIESFLMLFHGTEHGLNLGSRESSTADVWMAVLNLMASILTTALSTSTPGDVMQGLVEGICFVLRKHHTKISDILHTGYSRIADSAAAKQSEEDLNTVFILVSSVMSILTLLLWNISPKLIERNSGAWKNTSMFLTQWMNDFTMDIYNILQLSLLEVKSHTEQSYVGVGTNVFKCKSNNYKNLISHLLFEGGTGLGVGKGIKDISTSTQTIDKSLVRNEWFLLCGRYLRALSSFCYEDIRQPASSLPVELASLRSIMTDILMNSLNMNVIGKIYIWQCSIVSKSIKENANVSFVGEANRNNSSLDFHLQTIDNLAVVIYHVCCVLLHHTESNQGSHKDGKETVRIKNWWVSSLRQCVQATEELFPLLLRSNRLPSSQTAYASGGAIDYVPYCVMRFILEHVRQTLHFVLEDEVAASTDSLQESVDMQEESNKYSMFSALRATTPSTQKKLRWGGEALD